MDWKKVLSWRTEPSQEPESRKEVNWTQTEGRMLNIPITGSITFDLAGEIRHFEAWDRAGAPHYELFVKWNRDEVQRNLTAAIMDKIRQLVPPDVPVEATAHPSGHWTGDIGFILGTRST